MWMFIVVQISQVFNLKGNVNSIDHFLLTWQSLAQFGTERNSTPKLNIGDDKENEQNSFSIYIYPILNNHKTCVCH